MVYITEFSPANNRRTRINASSHLELQARFGNLIELWRAWRQRSLERRMAAQFTDRDLWDVGLTRGDIHREFARPFWRTDGFDPRPTMGETTGRMPLRQGIIPRSR
jgi:uncharacterized protein YjiS (DUF1127 family)